MEWVLEMEAWVSVYRLEVLKVAHMKMEVV